MERGLLCNSQVALAIREGRQSQDRRLLRQQPLFQDGQWRWQTGKATYMRIPEPPNEVCLAKQPHAVGDLLYVRETWRVNAIGYMCREHNDRNTVEVEYGTPPGHARGDREVYCITNEELARANHYYDKHTDCFSPNIHMPKWAAQTWLEVTRVWVEQNNEISNQDAIAEGYPLHESLYKEPRDWFLDIYDSLYPGARKNNVWNWCIEFKLKEK